MRSKIIGRLEQMQGEGGSGGYGATHMYLMVDQMLFYIVEWARGSVFFKELKVNVPRLKIAVCYNF